MICLVQATHENVVLMGLLVGALMVASGAYALLAVLGMSRYFRGRLLELSWIVLLVGAVLALLDGTAFMAAYVSPGLYYNMVCTRLYIIVPAIVIFTAIIAKMQRYVSGIPARIGGEEASINLDSPIRMFLDVARHMDHQVALRLARTIGVEFARRHRGILEADPLGLSKTVDMLRAQLDAKLYVESGVGVGQLVFETSTARCPEWKLRLVAELLAAFWEEAVAISHRITVTPRIRYIPGPGIIRIIISG